MLRVADRGFGPAGSASRQDLDRPPPPTDLSPSEREGSHAPPPADPGVAAKHPRAPAGPLAGPARGAGASPGARAGRPGPRPAPTRPYVGLTRKQRPRTAARATGAAGGPGRAGTPRRPGGSGAVRPRAD